ncbi:hypothetical protein CAI21_17820 [Alkalilimnicola ehrlichii]|uniref:GDT1 family protein n=1 Tax=Alkalilimnicola ehrlichii TaxID=351052 RepID=A0A3E0WHJ2_9GAMM|nr:TMEM165/GDT1 family protein [Alkalilimnicola ehrlichii]RFA26184.1 hypothetical protein CAI21_17820 [Alkalilimnicola ehrlichii]RFA31703.1 hypothetical protein CAL65_21720 [Alkalilimnicola ehrlichii]
MLDNTFDLAGTDPWVTGIIAFIVVALAEIGDKSQLVCMSLATRHRGWPIFIGASAAFILLNGLAVVFGATVAAWLPAQALTVAVALLFAGFGLHTLLSRETEGETNIGPRSSRSLVVSTFLIIFVAEFGDKTQLAVAGMSVTAAPLPVWVGASLGLTFSAGLGIVAGRTVLQRIPKRLLKVLSGLLFLSLALLVLVGY